MQVKIHLYTQSKPVERSNVLNTYEKGGLFCVMLEKNIVEKYPMRHIFRVTEVYDGDKHGQ